MEKSFFDGFRIGGYQRANFDKFLKAIHFSYKTPSIHIAGTNGKGSTATYIAYAYAANNYKVGLFQSPFLIKPNEMITINGEQITDEAFLNIFNKYKKEITKYDLSAFEIQTFVALTYFDQEKCDIAVIECGMGGEIDATNIFTPVLSIITSIALEHTDALGYSISEIAIQKAGIIKEEVPILIGDKLPEDALNVIAHTAKDYNSKLCYMSYYVKDEYSDDGYSFEYGEFGRINIQSVAKYSMEDCCMSLEAVSILKGQFPIDVDKVKEGIAKVKMPCRLDIVSKHPLVIIDGSHNPEGINALCDKSLFQITREKPIHVIFACFRDKNIANMLATIGSITDDLTMTTFDNPRARTEDEYFLFRDDYHFEADALALLKNKMEQFPDDAILVTGSLAFAGYMKDKFKEGNF